MPKELTHWWLAAEAVRRLPLDRPTRHLLEEQQAAYLVGAVLPDTLPHLLREPHSTMGARLTDAFHDSRMHSYNPLLACIAGTPDLSPEQQACLLGIATHIETDIVFHPFVFAQAGSNRGCHYRVETDLDLWLLQHHPHPPADELRELLFHDHSDSVFKAAASVLSCVFDPRGLLPPEAVEEALQQHALLQARYNSPGWKLLIRLLGLFPGTRYRQWQHLFYPLRGHRGRPVCWPERWQHPVSGVERGDTPEGLLTEAITRITALLRGVDDLGLTTALRRQPGENLLTGLSVQPPADSCEPKSAGSMSAHNSATVRATDPR